MWSSSDKTLRRSSRKYKNWKWSNLCQNVTFNSKWRSFCWLWDMGLSDPWICMLHTCIKFHTTMWNPARRRNFSSLCRGACRAILPHPCLKQNNNKIFTRLDTCATFHEFLNMLNPPKSHFICFNNNNNEGSDYNKAFTHFVNYCKYRAAVV